MFESADKYLREVLQERFDPNKLPPISKWQEELTAKLAVKDSLYRDYNKLKSETHNVEKIRASVKSILHSDSPKQITTKLQSVER